MKNDSIKIIGLTGGIGSGKTTVAKMFEALEIPIYVADEAAKQLVNSSASLRKAIVGLLGANAYKNETLDRSWVAQEVFNDAEKLQQLNAIIHPAVAKDFNAWVAKQQGPYCMKEAAILFESGADKNCDAIIVVTAPESVRIARVVERDGSDEAAVRARMKHQLSDAERVSKADYVIENLHLEETKKQVEAVHRMLIKMP
tara:strand:- start:10696 stop:11295 length:600 start_codon:yes stop_codon:yes gene_type:complete